MESRITPSYAVMTVMQTGHYDEIYKRPGLAHFVEHMLFEGSPYLQPGELHAYEDRYFQQANAGTRFNETHLLKSDDSGNFWFKPEELVSGYIPVIQNAFCLDIAAERVAGEGGRIANEIAMAIQDRNFSSEKKAT